MSAEGGHAAAVPEADAGALLRLAQRSVARRFGEDDPLPQTAIHLIRCAAELVAMLPKGDSATAHDALAQARAAVITASYAVRRVHDEARIGSS